DGIRYFHVTGVQTCALPIYSALLRMTNPPSAEGKLLVFAPRDFDIRPGDDLLVLDVDIHVLRRMQALQTRSLPGHSRCGKRELRSEERRVGRECSAGGGLSR